MRKGNSQNHYVNCPRSHNIRVTYSDSLPGTLSLFQVCQRSSWLPRALCVCYYTRLFPINCQYECELFTFIKRQRVLSVTLLGHWHFWLFLNTKLLSLCSQKCHFSSIFISSSLLFFFWFFLPFPFLSLLFSPFLTNILLCLLCLFSPPFPFSLFLHSGTTPSCFGQMTQALRLLQSYNEFCWPMRQETCWTGSKRRRQQKTPGVELDDVWELQKSLMSSKW